MNLIKKIKNVYNTIKSINKRFGEANIRFAEANKRIDEIERQMNISTRCISDIQGKMGILESYGVFLERNDVNDNFAFSQAGEDMILSFVFEQLKIDPKDISYLDLGANRPKKWSNTYYFYRKGARGVLVEANPALISELKFFRNKDVVLNKCISDKSKEVIEFYVMSSPGLSSASKSSIDEFLQIDPELKLRRTIKIETITVSDIIEQYFTDAPTLLSIDIEGKEEDVLHTIDFNKCRPLAIICETITYRPQHMETIGITNHKVKDVMKNADYVEYAFTGINSIFLDKHYIDNVVSITEEIA